MVKPFYNKSLHGIKIVAGFYTLGLLSEKGWASLERPQVQELVAEFIEWLAETREVKKT